MTVIGSTLYRETAGRGRDDFVTQSQTGPTRDQMPSEVDSGFIWDLTATDVFPVASSEPPPGPDDAPGASGS
jgi:hypothetical protein